MKLNTITYLVKSILEDIPETRDNDYLLWLKVLQGSCDLNKPVGAFLADAKYMRYPHYETVSRVRRKLQENYPELRASPATQIMRDELEGEYREYARSNV